MSFRGPYPFLALAIGFCSVALIAVVGCAVAPSTGGGEPEAGSPAEEAMARAEEAGVTFEITDEGIVLRAEEEGVQVMRASHDLETWVVERLPPGKPAAFPRGQQLTLVRHLATFPLDCKPGACPTPKPIPLTFGGHGVPGAEGRPERTSSTTVTCFCDDPITRREDSACYEECKNKPIRIPG